LATSESHSSTSATFVNNSNDSAVQRRQQ
jgi:hypothetical protein